jgi:hypothetical protein
MKKYLCFAFLILTGILLGAQENLPLKRFGLFIGANDGGGDRATLRYAITDAEGMANILQDLGGMAKEHSVILRDPGSREIWQGFETIEELVIKEKPTARRVEFVFYYSGHADEKGFLIGREHLSYSAVRDRLGEVGADVKIAIIDSCSSGAFTRTKGGTPRSPFLIDESNRMQGHAYLTSSSEDEFSQESDSINGSFFTHYLLSGLRGAADSTRDGKVTLNELYEHAFTHTLNRTESTNAGPQHPSYEIQLTGTGDLVLSDLSFKSSTLVLSADVKGKVFVRNQDGLLIAEFFLRGDTDLTLALEPGQYRVQLIQDSETMVTRVNLDQGGSIRLSPAQFQEQRREVNTVRGGETEEPEDLVNINIRIPNPFIDLFDEEPQETIVGEGEEGLSFLSGGVTTIINFPVVPGFLPPEHTMASFSPLIGWEKSILGAQLAAIGASADQGVFGAQMAGIYTLSQGDFIGGQTSGVFARHEGDFLGSQISGIFVENRSNFVGGQVAGVYSTNGGDFLGAQTSGIFNRNDGELKGAQLAGIFNLAADLRGVQIAGILNRATTLMGAQIGLINIAEEAQGSLQLGLINIIGSGNGLPIGLINIGYDMGFSYQTYGLGDYWHNEITFRTASTTFSMAYAMPVDGDPQEFFTKLSLGFRSKVAEDILGIRILGDLKFGLYADLANWSETGNIWHYSTLNPYLSTETSLQVGFIALTLGLENGWFIPTASSTDHQDRQQNAFWSLDLGKGHRWGAQPYLAFRLF